MSNVTSSTVSTIAPLGTLAGDGQAAATKFLDTPLGTFFVVILGAIGVVAGGFFIIKAIPLFSRQQVAKGLMQIFLGVIIMALLFNIRITIDWANAAQGLFSSGSSTVKQLDPNGTGGVQ